MTLALWSADRRPLTIADVPKIRAEDRQFALRLGAVLRELRAAAGLTQEQAAEELKVVAGTLGRWERGDYAPKGYDLGRLFRGYRPFGAQWEWFFDPPEIVTINPVRARLDELAERGTTAAHSARRPAAQPGPQAGGRRGAVPRKHSA